MRGISEVNGLIRRNVQGRLCLGSRSRRDGQPLSPAHARYQKRRRSLFVLASTYVLVPDHGWDAVHFKIRPKLIYSGWFPPVGPVSYIVTKLLKTAYSALEPTQMI